jgi:hypothetical protein
VYRLLLGPRPGPGGRVWFKNRFASCHAEWIILDHYRTGSTLPIDRSIADYTVTYNMTWNAREVLAHARLANWRFTGIVNKNTTFINSALDCIPVNYGAGADCDSIGLGKTLGIWERDPDHKETYPFLGEDPPDPNEPAQVQAEKRTFYGLYSQLEARNCGVPICGETEEISYPARCDVARSTNPNYAKSSDCVFHGATGWLKFDVNDSTIKESAQLYYDAHQDFDKTYPGGGLGKYVPGNIGVPTIDDRTEPIRRNFYDQLLQNNNYNTSVRFCKENWGDNYATRPDGGVNECDEFPFKTTYEGSFTITTNMLRTVAVRPVLREHNRETGSRWGRFLAEDHILDGDRVYVTAYK